MCVLDVIDAPSMLRLTRKAAALARVLPTFPRNCEEIAVRRKWKSPRFDCGTDLLKLQKSGQFPDETVRITV